ncbi:tRNA (5-methylaminomethyl-2-thiouridine)(34)-methyltransferase MnmD [Aureisphaera sp. CAU 1614]|uniref:tRNA (5-methylaminomethyl-2-thiouridine)(34)-methyltransferase MnmD n=1 Tax=Halomarinibacterium sedimenti TaxID=2857106 RepID=A0A9X1JYR9_9FLAO|nr:tRNA (5-methylaminomethyl-2-thiouridine)(34)-methyltransferase MnmD [Halomarinibacterium sedimenti]MBW2936511.1 tRNA (5-methylaminomethyl-2-thiouridine)(34)-methyltransferase MnmD [Halomarinibacterium sedimenti]
MKREFLTTGDGSITIHIPEWNEQYHSKHGAINEALHVFIQAGLRHFLISSQSIEVQILEIGFGTGLNAFLTQLFSEKEQINIEYTGVEAYPVLFSDIEKLNYQKLLESSEMIFEKLHQVPWEKPTQISENFTLKKRKQFFSEIDDVDAYNLIYFDAFGARVQPELWTEAIFEKMYRALMPEGVLVTYAAKGSVRRAMEAVGFKVERLPGPPGKREMLRSIR